MPTSTWPAFAAASSFNCDRLAALHDVTFIVRPCHGELFALTRHKGELKIRVLGDRCFRFPDKQQVITQTGLEFRHDVTRDKVAVLDAHAAFHTMPDLGTHTNDFTFFRCGITDPDTWFLTHFPILTSHSRRLSP